MDEIKKKEIVDMMKHPEPKKYVNLVRIQMVKDGKMLYGMGKIDNPYKTASIVKPLLRMSDKEKFVVIAVNTRMIPINVEIVSVGTPKSCTVSIADVFKSAILSNAQGIVCAHNHPSGCLEPSKEDISITKKLIEAGKMLGIRVLDHIVIGDDDYRSLKESGEIEF